MHSTARTTGVDSCRTAAASAGGRGRNSNISRLNTHRLRTAPREDVLKACGDLTFFAHEASVE
jgi:hypothetical protein